MNNMKMSDKIFNGQMGYDMGVPDNCQTMFSPMNVYNNNTCLKCNKVYINKHNLSKHLLEVHGQKLSSQETQEFQYQLSKNGKKKNVRKIPPKQTCIICDKVLINNYNLKRHLMSVHKINSNDFSSFMLSAHTSKQLRTHVDINAATHKDLISSIRYELNTKTHMAINNNNTDFKQSNNVQKFQVSNYNSHSAIDNVVSNQQNDELYFVPDQSNKAQPIPTYDNTVTLYKAPPLETDIVETYHNVDTYATSNWPKEIQTFLENSDNIQITENKYGSDKLNTQVQDTENNNTLYNQSNQTQISKTYKNEMQVESYDYTLFDQINKIQDLQTSNSDMEISRNAFTIFNPTKKEHEIPTYGDNTMTLYNTQTLETNSLHSYGAVDTHVASSWPESVKIIETNNGNMQTMLDNYDTDEMNQVWPHQMFDCSMSLAKNNGTSHNQSNPAQICEAYNNETQLEPHKYTVFDHLNKVHVLEVHNNNETQIDLDTYAKPEQLNKEPTFQMLSDETQPITNNNRVLKQPNNEQMPQSLNNDSNISISHTATSTSDKVLASSCEMYCAMPIDNIMSDLTHSNDTCLNTPILPNDTQTAQTYSDHAMTTLNTQTLEINNTKTHEFMEKSVMSNEPSTDVQKELSYFCRDCNVQFQSQAILLKHTLSMHKTNQNPPKLNISKQKINKRDQSVICPICNRQLRKDYLKTHLKNVHKQEIKIITADDKMFCTESDTNVKADVPTNNIVSDLPTIDLKQNDNSCLVTPIQPNDTQMTQTYIDHISTTLNNQTSEINNLIKHDFTEKSVMSNKLCKREQKKFTHLCQNCDTQFQSKFMLLKHTREMHNTKQKQVKTEVHKQKIVNYNKNIICHICNNKVRKTYLMTHLKNMHKQEMNIITKTDKMFCIESIPNGEAHVTTNNMSDLPSMNLTQNDNTCLVTSSQPQTDQTFSDHAMTTLNTQTLVANSPTIHESTEKSVMSNESHTREQEKQKNVCHDCNVQFHNTITFLKHIEKMHNTKALDASQQKLLIPETPKHEIIQNNLNVNCHECGKSVRKNYLKRHLKTMHEQNMIITEKSDTTYHNESSIMSDLSTEKSDKTFDNESSVDIEDHVTTNNGMSDLPTVIDLTQNDDTCLVTSGQPNGTQTAQTYSDPIMTTLNTQTSESNKPKTHESVEKSVMFDESSTRVQKKLSYSCRDCNVQFQNKSMLLKHAREIHSIKQKQIKSELPKNKIIQNKRNINCHICSKQMRQKYLKTHLKNIHGQETIAPAAKTMPHIKSEENIEHCVNNNNIVSDPTHGDNTRSVIPSRPDDAQTVRAYSDQRTDAIGEHEATGGSIKMVNLQDNGDDEMQAAADAFTVSDSPHELQSPSQTSNNNAPIDEQRETAALDRSNEVQQTYGAESPVATTKCSGAITDQSKSKYTDETREAADKRSVELQNIENLIMLAKVANGDDGWLYDLLSRPFNTPKRSKLTMVWSKCTQHKSCIYSDGMHSTFDEIQRELDVDEPPECVTENDNIDLTELRNADDTNAKSVDIFECVAIPNRLNILITRKKGHVTRGKTRTEPDVLARKKNYCKFCDVSFETRKSHVEHIKYMHQTLKQAIKCDQCHYMFVTEHLYHDHLETVHKNRKSPYECDVCDKEFKAKHELKKHFKETHGGKPYECTICEIIFFKEANRDLHMVSAHDCFKCDICYLKFDSQQILDSHKNGHTQTRMFVCDYLSCAHLPFSTKKRLKDHLKSHGD